MAAPTTLDPAIVGIANHRLIWALGEHLASKGLMNQAEFDNLFVVAAQQAKLNHPTQAAEVIDTLKKMNSNAAKLIP